MKVEYLSSGLHTRQKKHEDVVFKFRLVFDRLWENGRLHNVNGPVDSGWGIDAYQIHRGRVVTCTWWGGELTFTRWEGGVTCLLHTPPTRASPYGTGRLPYVVTILSNKDCYSRHTHLARHERREGLLCNRHKPPSRTWELSWHVRSRTGTSRLRQELGQEETDTLRQL
jgi:hypothetical protein